MAHGMQGFAALVVQLHQARVMDEASAWRLVCPGEGLADHHRRRAQAEGLQHVTRVEDGARRDHRAGGVVLADVLGHLVECRGLGPAVPALLRLTAPDDDRIRPRLGDALRLPAGQHGPRNDVDLRILGLHRLYHLELAVVRGLARIYADDVGARLRECRGAAPRASRVLGAIIVPATGNDPSAGQQLPVEVPRHAREVPRLLDVGASDHGDEPALAVHDRKLGNLSLLELVHGLLDRYGLHGFDHPPHHDVGDLGVAISDGVRVARAEETDELRIELAVLRDADATDPLLPLDLVPLLHCVVRPERHGLQDETADVALRPLDHLGLRLDALVAVDEADGPYEREADGQVRLSHGVRGAPDEGQREPNPPRQLAARLHL
mmetsp:Transcript_21416/g.64277  ORF Transcript_21416/g.64277 Transcript_21416/m.64277 type:complete len:379 (-) Transcript_21416:171-1307(-)